MTLPHGAIEGIVKGVEPHEEDFVTEFRRMVIACGMMAKVNGWWDDSPTVLKNDFEFLLLCTDGDSATADLRKELSDRIDGLVPHYKAAKIALIQSEASECVEAIRKDLPSDHIDGPMEVEELADIVIRIMDYCFYYNIPIGETIIKKFKYNASRPYRHGGAKL